MRNTITLLSLSAAAMMFGAACDEDDEGDPCQQAAAVVQSAADEFCSDKTDACCLCACWSQTAGYYDVDTHLAENACQCIEPPPDNEAPVDAACEGEYLEEAQACLDNEDACVQPQLESMQVVCDGSAI